MASSSARTSAPANGANSISKKTGRPTDYDPSFDDLAHKFCLLGATDAKLAEFFGVTEQTINNWKNAHPSFFESITRGKEFADAEVAASLFHRAKGYSHPSKKIMQYQGVPVEVEYVEHYPPDTEAGKFWLINRQRDKWLNRTDHANDPTSPLVPQAILCPLKELPGASAAPVAAKPKAG